ncbi:MAG: hypothetical protein NTY48_04495, partial [Candidatus Diapherotrites archaeon]|nr:hypothetical protein [Candidatus Diapherotrites archaeon]
EKNRLEEKKLAVEGILPQLQKQINSSMGTQATVFNGFKAVTNLLKGMLDELNSGEEYYVLGARYVENLPEQIRYFIKHHQRRVAKGIKLMMLANEDIKPKIIPDTKINSEIKYLPNYLMTDMQIFIYRNKTLLVVWMEEPLAFLIESEVVRKSFQKYFGAFWKIAKK